MTREEFRANLYQAYIASGMHDPVLVQEYINIAESFVFDKKVFTKSDDLVLREKLSN